MNPVFFNDVWRMDWGLGNPNKTAALIAILMIAVWGFAYIRRWGFWVALTLFTVLGICLMHTISRGGLISLVAGLIPLVAFAPRPWPKSRIIGVIVGAWMMVGAVLYFNSASRYTQGIASEDRSITNRFSIWKEAPKMMADAPGGWGIGKSGDAFMQWYQATDRGEAYRTLVNSHLTWLVEFGWPLRFLYVFGWLLIFLLCWPFRGVRWLAVPLGVWITFATSATFSSVAESPWLWIVPGLYLLLVLIYRLAKVSWFNPRFLAVPLGATAAMMLVLFLVGSRGSNLTYDGNQVTVGSGEEKVYLLVDQKILGKTYGKTLRRYLEENPRPFSIILSDRIPAELPKKMIVAGQPNPEAKAQLASAATKLDKLVFLSPAVFPQELNLSAEDLKKVEVVFGEFSDSAAGQSWRGFAQTKLIEGAADFLPKWPEAVFSVN